MDIIVSKASYPANALSNFAPHRFVLNGVQIGSFEGFLQSLKFEDLVLQLRVCSLVGWEAKKAGQGQKWWRDRRLFWQGGVFDRDSADYQTLLDVAYQAMFDQNEDFRMALKASGDEVLTHSIGKVSPRVTILTRDEFCGRLMRLRRLTTMSLSTNSRVAQTQRKTSGQYATTATENETIFGGGTQWQSRRQAS